MDIVYRVVTLYLTYMDIISYGITLGYVYCVESSSSIPVCAVKGKPKLRSNLTYDNLVWENK